MKKIILPLGLLFYAGQAAAMFCPTGFNQINIGDTIEQVTQQCGAPDSKKTDKEILDTTPQVWTYYVKYDPSQPGTVQMMIAFDASQKMINITVNGTSLSNSSLCGGNVQLGDTTASVKKACGAAALVNKGETQNSNAVTNNNQPSTETTTFKYTSQGTPTTLIFMNGKLKERQ